MSVRATRIAALLALALAAPATADEPDYATAGDVTVRQIDDNWIDGARHREIPLRLRLPQSGEHLPVIVFSHGLGGSRAGGDEWGAHWASHGFAVIHVQHPGSDDGLWKDKPPAERLAALRGGADYRQFLARIADIRFVVAELDRRRLAGDALSARLDIDRLGMSGHSFGAIAALYLGGQRPAANAVGLDSDFSEQHFRAFLAFSPQATGPDPAAQFAKFTRPALLVTGTLDGQPFPGIGALPEQRLVPFEAMPVLGNKYLPVINHADHIYFNGTRGLRDYDTSGRGSVDFANVEARGYKVVKAVSTAYWLTYLNNDPVAAQWLRDGKAARLAAPDGSFKMK